MSISRGNKGFIPADMYEDNDNVVVETQLAGIDLEKLIFLLRMMFYVLKVKVKKDEAKENYYRKEIRRGNLLITPTNPS